MEELPEWNLILIDVNNFVIKIMLTCDYKIGLLYSYADGQFRFQTHGFGPAS